MSPPVEKGSLVLVTGANGYIGSHVVDQLLSQGMKVRGTIRTQEKGGWIQEYFDDKYGKGKLQLVIVPDFSKPGAYDEAVKGLCFHGPFRREYADGMSFKVFTALHTSLATCRCLRTLTMSSPAWLLPSTVSSRQQVRRRPSQDSSSHHRRLLLRTPSQTQSSP